MLIQYTQKMICGRQHYYPLSDDAKTICKLIKRPTLTSGHLQVCNDAGWKLERIEEFKNITN